MAIKLEGAQLLLYRAAANADRGLPSAYETAVAKAACNQVGFEVAQRGGAGHGRASATAARRLVEYCMRRCRGWMIAGGSVEMLKNRIAEHIFDRRFDQRRPKPCRAPRSEDRRDLRQALLVAALGRIVGQSDRRRQDRRPAAEISSRQARLFAGTRSIRSIRGARRVLGERAWPSLAALPEAPDHAYIVTPTDAAVAAVEECGRLGVPVATVLADGFAEAGDAGAARAARLREICARTGIRLVGPSSLGVVDLRSKVLLTANAAFAETDLPVGRIFAASHCGSMIGALLSRGKARGIGFAGLVSVGNEVDLSLGEICAATLDDPDIDGYLLFLETMRTPMRCAASRWRRRRAASRSSPTSSAARRRRASLRSRIPARSPARTMSPTRSSPIAASRASIRSTA